jgi:DNA repair exonuclease SbcCD ATPase subunit
MTEEANKEEADKAAQVVADATERGWKPEADYTGEPGTWIDAGEFLRRAPLYEGLHKANRTIKKLETQMQNLVKHNAETREAEIKAAIDRFKAQKKVAASEQDLAAVVEIDDKIKELEQEGREVKSDKVDPKVEAFKEWQSENKWYTDDEDMQAYANGIGSKVEREHPDWSVAEVLDEVAKRTKKAFGHKTKNPAREEATRVAGSNGSSGTEGAGAKGKLPTYNDLPAEAKQMHDSLVKSKRNPHGVMTSEQYRKDFALKAGLIRDEG